MSKELKNFRVIFKTCPCRDHTNCGPDHFYREQREVQFKAESAEEAEKVFKTCPNVRDVKAEEIN